MSKSLLWDSIQKYQCTTIAVMGMAKNTGKTVVLNHLLQESYQHSLPVGITSIGRDVKATIKYFGLLSHW